MSYPNYPTKRPRLHSRKKERYSLLMVSFVLGMALFTALKNFKKEFINVESLYHEKIVLNLDKELNPKDFEQLLIKGNYISTEKDAKFIAKEFIERLNNTSLANLGALNKDIFKINIAYADSMGGPEIKRRVEESYNVVQNSDEIEQLYRENIPNVIVLDNGNLRIDVVVDSAKAKTNVFSKMIALLGEKDFKPVEGVLIRLKEHTHGADSLNLTTYAKTDKNGKASFTGIMPGKYYSALPIKKGFEYGTSKGTIGEALSKNQTYEFKERAHQIKLFGTITYAQLKKDNVLTVRTPSQFFDLFIPYIIFFFLSWWMAHIYLVIRKRDVDELLLPILMTLSGISILALYAMQNPLTDIVHGKSMVHAVVIGLNLLLILTETNIIKWFNSKWFDLLFKKENNRGLIYFIIAIGITLLLFRLGSGPEGSGVSVNLDFGFLSFQPSEIAKYLILLFFASFFSRNADVLSLINRKERFLYVSTIYIVIVVLVGIYGLLGDMGPAMVLGFTFVLLYSIARRDFPQLLLGILSFGVILFLANKITPYKSLTILGVFSGLWLVLWCLYGWFRKKTFYESAFFFNSIIAAFIFGEALPLIGNRLKDRNAIFSNLWNNQVYGGDHIAQGIWSLVTGGVGGQGLGAGNSNVVPAYHTDMIFTSLGEELGWIGLILIIICFAILLHRTMLIGRKAGHPFTFYLASGIAVVTGVQFIIITFGNIGLIPLTGITLPFLSFGMVSMILNLTAFGIVLSISKIEGNVKQRESIIKEYDKTIASTSLAFTLTSLILIGTLFYYQVLSRNKYLVKPAMVADKDGGRISSYNPRISLLINELQGGNIYDRNNILLATGDRQLLKDSINVYREYGVPDSTFNKNIGRNTKRYYPFGDQLLFQTGDFNTRILWSDNDRAYAYNAEARFLSYLRGFDTKPQLEAYDSDWYRKDRFSPFNKNKYQHLPIYDYSQLIPLLKSGIRSNKVKQFNNVKRDVYLTLDASLQTQLQNELHKAFNQGKYTGKFKKPRVSVVVLNASSGDFLASANYPIPNQENLKTLYETTLTDEEYKQAGQTVRDLGTTYATTPGSTAKVISALAGFKKLGIAVKDKTFKVDPTERIGRVEPSGSAVTLEDAIVKSSNIYFIKLINEEKLDNQLSDIYFTAGIGVGDKSDNAYQFNLSDNHDLIRSKLNLKWGSIFANNRSFFYNEKLKAPKPKYYSEFSQLAWGQGQLTATPMAMARIAGIVANEGKFHNTKYVLNTTDGQIERDTTVEIISKESAEILKSYMNKQAIKKIPDGKIHGKTGTVQMYKKGKGPDDAWYIFFFYSEKMKSYISTAVRIEKGLASSNAMNLTNEVILPVFKSLKYYDDPKN